MSYRPQNNHDGLWWEIALGIFVGQLMTAALAGVVALCLGYFTMRSVSAALPVAPQPLYRPRTQPAELPTLQLRALESNERCIQHKRFRRLSKEPLNNAPQIRDTTRLMLRGDPCN
ncbi:chloride channel protein [Xanthomonas campestris pv. campestris]|uniref:chloride channel protein n=1 Tax=Xanthomonas campestris TaxID=339 RepID=UPI00388F2D26